jgi:hypothetical protein
MVLRTSVASCNTLSSPPPLPPPTCPSPLWNEEERWTRATRGLLQSPTNLPISSSSTPTGAEPSTIRIWHDRRSPAPSPPPMSSRFPPPSAPDFTGGCTPPLLPPAPPLPYLALINERDRAAPYTSPRPELAQRRTAARSSTTARGCFLVDNLPCQTWLWHTTATLQAGVSPCRGGPGVWLPRRRLFPRRQLATSWEAVAGGPPVIFRCQLRQIPHPREVLRLAHPRPRFGSPEIASAVVDLSSFRHGPEVPNSSLDRSLLRSERTELDVRRLRSGFLCTKRFFFTHEDADRSGFFFDVRKVFFMYDHHL